MGIFRKNDRRTNTQLLLDAYGECAKEPPKYLSDNFKTYIDGSLPEVAGHNILPHQDIRNPLRVAMLSGYFLRCAEVKLGQRRANKPEDKVETILGSNLDSVRKITAIADYLDDHDKLGLQEKVSNYSLMPFEAASTAVFDIAEDVYQHRLGQLLTYRALLEEKKMKKREKQEFRELIYRNVAYGYLFKLSEELVDTDI
jgi:hypothetical protein